MVNQWYESPEYQRLKDLRERYSETAMMVVAEAQAMHIERVTVDNGWPCPQRTRPGFALSGPWRVVRPAVRL